jgi:WD40 repeat protein
LVSTSGVENTIKIWDATRDFQQVGNDLIHDGVVSVIFSSDANYLVSAANREGAIKIFDATNNFQQVGNDLIHDKVTQAFFSPDERYLVAFSRSTGTIKLWDIWDDFQQVSNTIIHENFAIEAALSPNGKYLASVNSYPQKDGFLKIWSFDLLKQILNSSIEQIHLFVSMYINKGQNNYQLPLESQKTFVNLPTDFKDFLNRIAPQFKDAFKKAETAFEID